METKLGSWKRCMGELRKAKTPELGDFIGEQGTYFLKRRGQERGIYSFRDPITSFNRTHIVGEKSEEGYRPYTLDSGGIGDAGEREFDDFALIVTGLGKLRDTPHSKPHSKPGCSRERSRGLHIPIDAPSRPGRVHLVGTVRGKNGVPEL